MDGRRRGSELRRMSFVGAYGNGSPTDLEWVRVKIPDRLTNLPQPALTGHKVTNEMWGNLNSWCRANGVKSGQYHFPRIFNRHVQKKELKDLDISDLHLLASLAFEEYTP